MDRVEPRPVLRPFHFGETVCRDEGGGELRQGTWERWGVPLYSRREPLPGRIQVELLTSYLPLLNSRLILRWLDLPGAFLARGGLLLHASFVLYRDRAILFTAPKQTGKSTQAELWRRLRGARVLNGDRALLQPASRGWEAVGTPLCGTSGICRNARAPLAAVVILRQGPENRARRAAPAEAVRALISGAAYDPASRGAAETVLDLALPLAEAVPFFALTCRPDAGAVDCLEALLREEGVYGR